MDTEARFLYDQPWKKIATGMALLLLSGFLWAALLNSSAGSDMVCTEKACLCQDWDSGNSSRDATAENITDDIECNNCTGYRLLYHIGVFWVTQEKELTQMYVCEEGEKSGEYYRQDGFGEVRTGSVVDLPD